MCGILLLDIWIIVRSQVIHLAGYQPSLESTDSNHVDQSLEIYGLPWVSLEVLGFHLYIEISHIISDTREEPEKFPVACCDLRRTYDVVTNISCYRASVHTLKG